MTVSSGNDEGHPRGLSRRELLARGGGAGALLLGLGPVIAACGGGEEAVPTEAATTQAPATEAAATEVATTETPTTEAAPPPGDVSQIAELIGPIDPEFSGKGLEIDLGMIFGMSGEYSFYGDLESKAALLAMKHVQALGGPTFRAVIKDMGPIDPTKSASAAKELGIAHVPMCLSSAIGAYGAILPFVEQYKILTFDGDGGTSVFAQGMPYFWGTRAKSPEDVYPGVARYISERMPEVKVIAIVGDDLGPLNEIYKENATKAFERHGLTIGSYETVPAGTSDFSTAIQRARSEQPDLLFVFLIGAALGSFLKQYAASGIGKPTIGIDFDPVEAETAGDAMNGHMFAFDYWDAANPPNGWGAIFVQAHEKEYGRTPDYLAANYYEDVFVFWDLIRRVLARGGDPRDGAELERALKEQPTFKSLYGGDASRAGSLSFDLETHSLSDRPMYLLRYSEGRIEALATFNMGGRDYRELQ